MPESTVESKQAESVPQLDASFIETLLLERPYYRAQLCQFKFILCEGPENRGYIRFGTIDESHGSIDSRFNTEIVRARLDTKLFKSKGGGYAELKEFNPAAEEREHYEISFFDKSLGFGPFDRELLERTFAQSPHKRFSIYNSDKSK